MSLRGRLGFGRQHQQLETETTHENFERRELAHHALFAEITELRDVCKFLLNGHKNHVIYVDEKPIYNITCISGETTRIKVTHEQSVDDFSVSASSISHSTTVYSEDKIHSFARNFDITSAYMNGFSEAEMTEQLKALYDLQEEMLIAEGLIPCDADASKDGHYAA